MSRTRDLGRGEILRGRRHPPRESLEPGAYRGHAGVRDYLDRLGKVFGDTRVEPVDVIEVDADRGV